MIVRKLDDSRIEVFTLPSGETYIDPPRNHENRGGPFAVRHFHKFKDYGLADGFVRCEKCGRISRQLELFTDDIQP